MATENVPQVPESELAVLIVMLEKYVDEYVDNYEMDDGDSLYRPTDDERFLILDAINGLIADDGFAAIVAERERARAKRSDAQTEIRWHRPKCAYPMERQSDVQADDDEAPNPCTECGKPVRYGERHSKCGDRAANMQIDPGAASNIIGGPRND